MRSSDQPLLAPLVVALSLALGGASASATAQTAESNRQIELNIASQPLSSALNQVVRAANLQLLATPALLEGRTAQALQGSYTAEEAFRRLLSGTGIGYRFVDANTVALHDLNASAAPTVGREPMGARTQSVTGPDAAVTLERVTVTGSNIRTMTAAEEGPAPVAVITQQEMQLLGYKDIKDVLRFDAAFTGWSETEGYLSTRSTVNMRGLGDEYTLVLLNGRRFSAEQAADISLIPISAVERIEILKDGASALYGSDAVGGVVNIITRTRFEGVEVEAYYGNTADTDVSNNQLRLVFGGGNEKLRFLGSLAYTKRNDLYSEDRDITRSQDMRPWGGYDSRSSATNPAAFFVPGVGTVRLDTSRFGVGQYSINPADYVPYNPETDKWNRPFRSVLMPLERTNFFGSIESNPFEADFTFFGEILYSDAKTIYQGGSTVIGFADPDLGPIPASNPYNPFGVDISQLSYRTYEPLAGIYAAQFAYDTTATRLVGGFRGWLGEWSYEAAASYFTEETQTTDTGGAWSKSGLRAALARTGPDAFNPFCYGCNTPQQLAGVIFNVRNQSKYTSKTLDARTSGPLFDNWAGTISAAAGLEYRQESYLLTPDALYISGDILDSGYSAIEGTDRSVKALFAELSVPLIGAGENTAGAPTLELNLAARAEEYSDFGSTSNPKGSLRWQLPTAMPIILRASYGTSFKAPRLSQLLVSGVRVGDQTLMDPLTNQEVEAVVVTGTNPNLQPEEAGYSNFGLVVSPLDNERHRLTFAADYFRVKQRDVIIEPAAQDVLNGVSPGGVDRTPGAAQQQYGKDGDLIVYAGLVNGGDRQTEGVDFNASWERKGAQWGDLTVTLSTSRLLKRDVDIGDGRGDIDYAGFTPYPKWRGNLMVDWERNAWRVGMVNRYIGSFDGVVPGMASREVGSYTLTNVSVAYDFSRSSNAWLQQSALTRGTTIKFGIDNLFDRDPVFVAYQNGYIASLSDILGRSYYVSIKRKL